MNRRGNQRETWRAEPGANGERITEENGRRIREGCLPFGPGRTYYRIVGESRRGRLPLVLLHGGPGSTHNYFEVLDNLADTGRMVVMYDQIGCGRSCVDHGGPELFNLSVWMRELEQLHDALELGPVHLLGQSWGGMLIIGEMIEHRPDWVRSIILSSTLPSSALWSQEQHRMIREEMSPEDQAAIARAEASGDFSDPAYLAANRRFMLAHCAGEVTQDSPECLRREKPANDSYVIGWGPNEYTPTGTLRDFSYTDRLGEISVPALVINGSRDLCTDRIAQTMADGIPQAERARFSGCRHMCFVEDHDHYCAVLEDWMERQERG